ncbi:MAG: recombinase family protein [Crocosphaera sp.]
MSKHYIDGTQEGKLKPLRTVGGHRYYTDEHINQIKGIIKNPRINVIYCRVSSNAQKPELSNQVEAMKQFCTANGITINKVIRDFQRIKCPTKKRKVFF